MATECNIHDISWGFIEQAYELYKDELHDALRKKLYVSEIMGNIRKNGQ